MGKAAPKNTSAKTAKGPHGGGNPFSQVVFGAGFKNLPAKGINSGKALAKTNKPKHSPLTEGRVLMKPIPSVALGRGFVRLESTSSKETKTGKATKNKFAKYLQWMDAADHKVKSKSRSKAKTTAPTAPGMKKSASKLGASVKGTSGKNVFPSLFESKSRNIPAVRAKRI